jgi:hypothetical protein
LNILEIDKIFNKSIVFYLFGYYVGPKVRPADPFKETSMDNVATYLHGKKLFISIDLTKSLGKTQSGKSLNVATSRGYSPLNIVPGHRLKLHLYRLGTQLPDQGKQAPELAAEATPSDLNHILALASGLCNETREDLIGQIRQMISRDSLN